MTIEVKVMGWMLLSREIDKAVIKYALAKTLEYGQTKVKARTPKKTGRARKGWDIDYRARMLKNLVPYVQYLEDGTSRMPAKNMLKDTKPEIVEQFKREVTKRLKELG